MNNNETANAEGDQQQEETVEPTQSQAVSTNCEAMDSSATSQLQRSLAICDGSADALKSLLSLNVVSVFNIVQPCCLIAKQFICSINGAVYSATTTMKATTVCEESEDESESGCSGCCSYKVTLNMCGHVEHG